MTKFTVQHLDWDSNFMGFRVGRLSAEQPSPALLQHQLGIARAEGYRLLYWFTKPDDSKSTASAQAVKAILADRKIRLQQSVTPGSVALPVGVSLATKLTKELQSLAVQAGEYSRFRLDPTFGPDVPVNLYTCWLKNSLLGKLNKEVLMYQPHPDGPATGLLILGATAQRAEVVILAVDVASRGQGIGSTLIEAARTRARLWALPELQVVTQAINPACQFYAKQGFLTEHEEHVYHLWL